MRTSLRSLPAALACTGAVVLLCAAQSSAAWPARDRGSIRHTTIETVRHMTCHEGAHVDRRAWAKVWFGPHPVTDTGIVHHSRVHDTIRGRLTHFRCRVWFPSPGCHLHERCTDRHGDVYFYRELHDPV